jgi:AmmeMemoRadiSam system protein B
VYSGPVAAKAYVTLEPGSEVVTNVALLGPSHRVAFAGLAVPSSASFETPLGRVRVDETARAKALELSFVEIRDDAHGAEHSLEVQLPFLQEVLESFTVLPIAVGRAKAAEVSEALETLWGGDETVIVISSDLSHYHDYHTARRMDASTAEAIERFAPEAIGYEQACGRIAVQGLLDAASKHALGVRRLDLRSSGDTAGGRSEVVGYGAWSFTAARNGSP